MSSSALTRFRPAEPRILRVRSQNVMIDADLAALYRVNVKVLNQAVKRNRARFPADFMFQLTSEEARCLRSQFVTLDGGRGTHRKYLPYMFTEHGVAMLSSILRSSRAVTVNIEIMRACVRVRELIASNGELRRKIEALETKYDGQLASIFEAIRELMRPARRRRRRIGYRT